MKTECSMGQPCSPQQSCAKHVLEDAFKLLSISTLSSIVRDVERETSANTLAMDMCEVVTSEVQSRGANNHRRHLHSAP